MQKSIFITGASAGLGKATAKCFQLKGWNVIATMRNPEKETELNQLENVTLPLDVTNKEQIKTTVAKAVSLHSIDVVFNNAGYGLMGVLESFTDEQILKEINTNLLGVIRITQAFIPHFREKKSGVFISTTSIGGIIGFLANQLNLSPHYLSDLLRSLTGKSAQQHIQEKLIEKAKEYLSLTNLSVAEIAYHLGFEYPQSLNKLFKKKTNISPLEFRQTFN